MLNNEAASDDCSEVDDTESGNDEEEDEEEPMTKKVREVVKVTLLYCIYCCSEWKTSKSRLRHEIQCTHKLMHPNTCLVQSILKGEKSS